MKVDKQCIEMFLETLAAEKAVSINTIIAYRTDLSYCAQSLTKKGLIQANSEDLQNYLQILSQQQYSARSIARKISALRHFFAFLLSENIILHNPAKDLERPKRRQSIPKALSQDEVMRLLEHAHKDQSPEGIRLTAMLELMYASGIRVSEMLALRLTQLQHLTENVPHIIIKGKGGKERLILLNEQAMIGLKEYLGVRKFFTKGGKSDILFPSRDQKGVLKPLTRQRFGQLLKELAIAANIDPSHVAPHKIRHSFASHLLQNGADLRVVQELLGHSDISSTQIYTKVLAEQVQGFVRQHHPIAHEDITNINK